MQPTRRDVLMGSAAAALVGSRTAQAAGTEMTAPDLILTNGRITTLDRANPQAEAVAIATGHLRQHERVTHADRVLQEAVRRFNIGGSPKVIHWIGGLSP